MEVSSTGEIHLRGFTAGEMQNLLTRLGERRAEEAAESWFRSSISCWPSAALSGHSGELQAAVKLCSLPAFDKWAQKYSIHFWVFF